MSLISFGMGVCVRAMCFWWWLANFPRGRIRISYNKERARTRMGRGGSSRHRDRRGLSRHRVVASSRHRVVASSRSPRSSRHRVIASSGHRVIGSPWSSRHGSSRHGSSWVIGSSWVVASSRHRGRWVIASSGRRRSVA